jgi:chromosome segregation ATPase
MSEPAKPATKTPVERVAELEASILTLTGERDTARTDLTAMTGKYNTAQAEVTTKTNELTEERRQHADTKAKLQTAEGNFNAEKAAHDTLKTDFNGKVNTEAARIAAANSHTPAPTAPAGNPQGKIEDKPKGELKGKARIAAAAGQDLQGKLPKES